MPKPPPPPHRLTDAEQEVAIYWQCLVVGTRSTTGVGPVLAEFAHLGDETLEDLRGICRLCLVEIAPKVAKLSDPMAPTGKTRAYVWTALRRACKEWVNGSRLAIQPSRKIARLCAKLSLKRAELAAEYQREPMPQELADALGCTLQELQYAQDFSGWDPLGGTPLGYDDIPEDTSYRDTAELVVARQHLAATLRDHHPISVKAMQTVLCEWSWSQELPNQRGRTADLATSMRESAVALCVHWGMKRPQAERHIERAMECLRDSTNHHGGEAKRDTKLFRGLARAYRERIIDMCARGMKHQAVAAHLSLSRSCVTSVVLGTRGIPRSMPLRDAVVTAMRAHPHWGPAAIMRSLEASGAEVPSLRYLKATMAAERRAHQSTPTRAS